MSQKDKAILLIVSISVFFIYIGVWISDIPLSNKFIVSGIISILICLWFMFGGKDESKN